MSAQTYGFAHTGMDPRDFTPDFDQCRPEEIAAWRTALARAEAGKPWDDPHPPIEYNGERITRYSGSLWGIGTKTWRLHGGGMTMPRTMDDLRAEAAAAEHAAWARKHGMGKPDPALASHAAMRTRLHGGHRSQRILSDDSEYVGLAGERALCDHLGIALDTDLKPSGNGGVNAVVGGYTLNVYTYRKPYNLLVERGKATADVYVLAAYDEASRTARLLPRCWATRDEVLSQEPRDVGGMGVVSHAIPARALRPLEALVAYLGVQRAGDQPALF